MKRILYFRAQKLFEPILRIFRKDGLPISNMDLCHSPTLNFLDILNLDRCQKLMSRKCERNLVIYGYFRVSTINRDCKTQILKLEDAGTDKIFSEKYMGTKKEGREELEELLSYSRKR